MIYCFEDFQLNTATRELRRNNEVVSLPARAFDCLAYLVAQRDRAVGRDELIAAVWGRVEISNALLGHAIVRLRRCFSDVANDQRAIRTVPRFGYHWMLPVVESAESMDVPATSIAPPRLVEPMPAPAPPPARRSRERGLALIALSMAPIVTAFVLWFWPHSALTTTADQAPPAQAAPPVTAALVLPAEVAAATDWQWLRLGLMDFVAMRLRGAMPTAPSETVVSLLRQRTRADQSDLLHDPALAAVAGLRVQPRVRLDGARWRVTLSAFSGQGSTASEGEGDDPMSAARVATDALLAKLGREAAAIASTPSTPALDELLQRSGAAMLADQLEQARDLITRAAPELRQEPRAQWRLAQIALREGDYPAVERILGPWLDHFQPSADPALHARASLTLATALLRDGEAERAIKLYQATIDRPELASDHEVLGIARLGLGGIAFDAGRIDEAMSEFTRARTELATAGDELGVASVDVNVGSLLLARHRPADALPALVDAAAQFERLGAREGLAHALIQQAQAERALLDTRAVLAISARVWPAEAATNNVRMRWSLTLLRAQALAGVGRWDESNILAARIERESDPRADRGTRAAARLLGAEFALQRKDWPALLERLDAPTTATLEEVGYLDWTRALQLQAQALRGRGDDAGAAQVVAALRAAAGDDPWRGLQADLAEGLHLAATGQARESLPIFDKAMKAADALNIPDAIVGVGAAYLEALCASGEVEPARVVNGRIGPWAGRDARAALAQSVFYRYQGHDDAAERARTIATNLEAPPEAIR